MCGIAGMIDPALGRNEGERLLGRMLESIRHRGPDNSSMWIDMPVWLGHNRLSIIDLTDAANQPMEYDDLVIVYNGEVYNYVEIKEELVRKGHRFRTTSDTEVILAAYKEWGVDCVQRFMGMWAFAIWDKTKRELFCSRDRFGIKPFYYIHDRDKFYFGSEYKPLKLSALFDGRFNYGQMSRGLWIDNMFSHGHESYFECLKVLPERSNLIFKDGRLSVSEYWDIDPHKKFRGTFEEKTSEFNKLFRNSVGLHMRSDVAVGISLSGGLDSSSIASVIGADQPELRIKSFTIYYDGNDERPLVNKIVDSYPNIEPIYYSPSDDEVAAAFDVAANMHDVPFPYSPAISSYFVMKLAKQHGIKVMLDGQGADEYLAGYSPFDMLIGEKIRKLNLIQALKTLRSHSDTHHLELRDTLRLAQNSLRMALTDEPALYNAEYHQSCTMFGSPNGTAFGLKEFDASRLKQHLYHLMYGRPLPALLHYGDRMSMAFSIENRVPFLDHRLVEFAHSLEDDDLLFVGMTKYILRKALRSILPNTIAEQRVKQQFRGREVVKWLRGPLRYLSEHPFDFDRIRILDPVKVQTLMSGFRAGDDSRAQWVWKLVQLNHWAAQQS
jgi:asparagine synthase (glutamine-hydrolysing)